MSIVNRRHITSLGLVIVLASGSLHRFPEILAAYWRNLGAVGIIGQLVKGETSVIDAFVNSEQTTQDMIGWKTPIKVLENAVRWSPTSARSHYLLHTAYWNVGALDKMNLFFDRTLCERCTADDLLVLLEGVALYQVGNRSEAWRTWSLNPDLDVMLVELGFRLLKNEERAKMYEFWEGAEALNPTPKLAKARMYKYMCQRSFRFQEWLEAKHWCCRWQSVQPSQNVDLMVTHALIGSKEVEEAEILLDQVRRSPDASNLATMGQIYWLDGRIGAQQSLWLRAFDSFDRALELAPDNRFLYLHYAAALLDAGRLETAKAMLETAEHLDDGTLAQQIAQLRSRIQ